MQQITQQELKEHLSYNPTTGKFTRLQSLSSRVSVGDDAGSVDSNGYVLINVKGRKYKAHRLAVLYMSGVMPDKQVDHIDRIRHNNAWSNLREASQTQNQRNTGIRADNSTGFKGVSPYLKKFIAQIQVLGVKKHLGVFTSPKEASEARESYAKSCHGEFYHAAA